MLKARVLDPGVVSGAVLTPHTREHLFQAGRESLRKGCASARLQIHKLFLLAHHRLLVLFLVALQLEQLDALGRYHDEDLAF